MSGCKPRRGSVTLRRPNGREKKEGTTKRFAEYTHQDDWIKRRRPIKEPYQGIAISEIALEIERKKRHESKR